MEEWSANEICASDDTVYEFDSSIEVKDACALVGFIELRQATDRGLVMCSSAPWEVRKHRAENWDVFVLPFKSRISGTIELHSIPRVFGMHPSYDITIQNSATTIRMNLTLDRLLHCLRLGARAN